MEGNEHRISISGVRGGLVLTNDGEGRLIAHGGVDNLDVTARFEKNDKGRLQATQVVVTAVEGSYIDVAAWRSVPIARMETMVNLPEQSQQRTRRSLRLPKPQGRRYPDSFYERVAEAYRYCVSSDPPRPPGESIAEANGVPTTTTRRWIAEARRRRLLEPAQSMGRVG
jgi:hypothetical protein